MTWVDPVGLYRPGRSWVHRTPLGVRLAVLGAFSVALVVLRGLVPTLVGLAAAVGVAVVARLAWRPTLRGLAPVLLAALVVAAVQTWQEGPVRGVEPAADLLSLALAATVVTATTPADALLDTVTRALRPLRRVGVDPEVVALAVQLMLRTVPALGELAGQTRDAARARGLERSARAVLVPLAVRTVARAHTTGDALAARGLGDRSATP